MNLEVELILVLVVLMLWYDSVVVFRTLSNKAQRILSAQRRSKELAELARLFEAGTDWKKERVRRLFRNYFELKQSIDLPVEEKKEILELAEAPKIEAKLTRKIRSLSRVKRLEAAQGLGLIASNSARKILETALLTEKDWPVKLYIANALADIKDSRSVPVLAESLIGAHRWYRDKVNKLIASFGRSMEEYVFGLFWREEIEIKELLVDLSETSICGEFEEYLLEMLYKAGPSQERLARSVRGCPDRSCAHCMHGRTILEDDRRNCRYEGQVKSDFVCRRFSILVTSIDPVPYYHRLLVKAAEALEKNYFAALDDARFLDNPDPEIKAVAIRSLGCGREMKQVRSLLAYLGSELTAAAAKIGMSRILSAHPRYIPLVAKEFEISSGEARKNIADVLAGRLEYFIGMISGRDKEGPEKIIREILAQGRVSELVEFLKRNQDIEIENELARIIREEAPGNETLSKECGLYLDERLLEKCGLSRREVPPGKREEPRDWKMVRAMWFLLGFALLLFPTIYVIRYSDRVAYVPVIQQLRTYIVDFNTMFAYYSILVNLVYIALLVLSWFKVRSLTKLWDLKTMSMLFKPRMLPSVSIIAPAYNEEKTIIESANSLLNLKYPDYELVIVNDGSRDGTLATLISHFGLSRTDYFFSPRLKCKSVRGIYRNPILPRLIVVDKDNGGKADSLNAGINISSKEYFCGIDADSLLEPDALLKVASLTLDSGSETPAMGGNVFPINGCTVDRGKITSVDLPKNNLAKLQTIEYLRAFMCGRLGWAQQNNLLIISGAFGLFRKERVISIGGYMTSNERYQKDTVGEDMELVVRISRMMRERKQKYVIGYAFNANCWTEVPEDLKTLKRQRNRWHRGLVDILYFHRKLIFNPSYGRMGIVGMPYYFIFELLGPLFEIQGYIMVGLAAVFGLLSAKLALLLFAATILMGIMISMASVLISERSVTYFNYKDTLRMLLVALLENFGPRQMFSMWRVLGFFNAMKKPTGWGKMDRKGFAPKSAEGAKGGKP
ncbi:MAG: glycosyltransferase [Rectinemataceae bacterium]